MKRHYVVSARVLLRDLVYGCDLRVVICLN